MMHGLVISGVKVRAMREFMMTPGKSANMRLPKIKPLSFHKCKGQTEVNEKE